MYLYYITLRANVPFARPRVVCSSILMPTVRAWISSTPESLSCHRGDLNGCIRRLQYHTFLLMMRTVQSLSLKATCTTGYRHRGMMLSDWDSDRVRTSSLHFREYLICPFSFGKDSDASLFPRSDRRCSEKMNCPRRKCSENVQRETQFEHFTQPPRHAQSRARIFDLG